MGKDCCGGEQKSLVPIEEAINHLTGAAKTISRTQTIPLQESRNRILATDVRSPLNVPPHDNSAMDGYAVNSNDLANKGEIKLPVSQRINAGATGEPPLQPGTAARIFTGAPIPPQADAVIMQEQSRREGDFVYLQGQIETGRNIRKAGEDIAEGDIILRKGQTLTVPRLGLAASIGRDKIEVFAKPKVAIICTGDELVDPGTALQAGQIYNSNRFTMRALLEAAGCEVLDMGIVRDTHEETRTALVEAAQNADLVMTSGGVSVGEEDHVRNVIEELGQLDLWRLNIKPGKPLAFGKYQETPVIGLPGNPVSVFVTFTIIARPFILKMKGAANLRPPTLQAIAGFDWPKGRKRREFLRVRLDENGHLVDYPHQGSGVLTSVAWADGLAIAREHQTFAKGDLIDYLPFGGLLG